MQTAADGSGEYSIDVSAIPDAMCQGYVARVVVKQLPAMREVFREEFLACGRAWTQPQNALVAALAKGQQFVRVRLCGGGAPFAGECSEDDGCGPGSDGTFGATAYSRHERGADQPSG